MKTLLLVFGLMWISQAGALDFGAEKARLASFKLETRSKATKQPLSSGTGFFVQGHALALTNNHVATDAFSRPDDLDLVAIMPNGDEVPARVVHVEMALDLAALRLQATPQARLALRSEPARLGEPVASSGFGAGLKFSLAQGLVAAKDENEQEPRLQLSSPSDGGVSGGPTLDAQGRALGVNVAGLGRSISFAVPAADAELFLRRAAAKRDEGALSREQAWDVYKKQLIDDSRQTLARLLASQSSAQVGAWSVNFPSNGHSWKCGDREQNLSDALGPLKPWQARQLGFSCRRDTAGLMAGSLTLGQRWSFSAYAYEPRADGPWGAWRLWSAHLATGAAAESAGRSCSTRRYAGARGQGHVQTCAQAIEGMDGLWSGRLVQTVQAPKAALALSLNFEGLDAQGMALAAAWLAGQARSAQDAPAKNSTEKARP